MPRMALLVIDVQNEYFTGKLPVTFPNGSLANILRCMDESSKSGIPVAVIQHSSSGNTFRKGTAGWELHDEIRKRKYDVLIEKHLPGSFTGTGLEDWLRQHNIDTVAITGYMTQMCCDTTARQALHRGYGVEFLSDATGTLDITNSAGYVSAGDLHKAILVTQESRFSKVMDTDSWIMAMKDTSQ